MSYEAEYYYELCDTKVVVARKRHSCTACSEPIERGQRYVRFKALFDKRWDLVRRCARCELIYRHLCSLLGESNLDVAPALDCGLSYEDEWGAQPDAVARLAFVNSADVQGEL